MFKKTIASLCLDIGKLAIGSLLLGSVVRGGLNPNQTFGVGALVSFGFITVGLLIIRKLKE